MAQMNDAKSVSCRACTGRALREFFHLSDVPLQDGLLYATRDLAIASPTGEIQLVFCQTCGHVFNRAYEPSRLTFNPEYDISLFHSPMYRAFCDELVARLVREYDLKGKTAIEIACGRGDFLSAMLRGGISRAIGYDPSCPASAASDLPPGAQVFREYFDARSDLAGADLIVCRSALQYFLDPRSFVSMLRAKIGKAGKVKLYFEVPHAMDVFRDLTIWNVAYETGSWFWAGSLARLVADCGFDVLRVAECFGGQNLEIDAVASDTTTGKIPAHIGDPAQLAVMVQQFSQSFATITTYWRAELDKLLQAGVKFALWGSGARGIMFCSMFNVPHTQVPYVVDINPRRQGRFLPRTGQEVVPPEFLRLYKPDMVIATNSTFAPEIERQIRDMGLNCDFRML